MYLVQPESSKEATPPTAARRSKSRLFIGRGFYHPLRSTKFSGEIGPASPDVRHSRTYVAVGREFLPTHQVVASRALDPLLRSHLDKLALRVVNAIHQP